MGVQDWDAHVKDGPCASRFLASFGRAHTLHGRNGLINGHTFRHFRVYVEVDEE
jgi:hypothetical protein